MVQRSGVLIETYWNVKLERWNSIHDLHRINRNILECKDERIYQSGRNNQVLIETYWNVKTKSYSQLTLDGRSINRNILECKGRKEKATGAAEKVLIETYWNVKYDMKKISGSEFLY